MHRSNNLSTNNLSAFLRCTLLCTLLVAAAAACGSDGTEPGPGDPRSPQPGQQDGSPPPPSGTFKGKCCLNGSYYKCDTTQAFDLCAGFDVIACHDACGFSDIQCQMDCDDKAAKATHDPSQCARRADLDGDCGTTTPTPTGCVGTHNGMKCSYSTQCPGGYHCSKGMCYADTIGNPCSYSTQCTSGNCTSSCCQGRTKGSPCSYSTQCDSGNCTGGTCQ